MFRLRSHLLAFVQVTPVPPLQHAPEVILVTEVWHPSLSCSKLVRRLREGLETHKAARVCDQGQHGALADHILSTEIMHIPCVQQLSRAQVQKRLQCCCQAVSCVESFDTA